MRDFMYACRYARWSVAEFLSPDSGVEKKRIIRSKIFTVLCVVGVPNTPKDGFHKGFGIEGGGCCTPPTSC